MTQKSRSHDTGSETATNPAQPSPKPKYEAPQVRMIAEEEALSAFQVVLSAGSGWWVS
jgi:hypothetical protein